MIFSEDSTQRAASRVNGFARNHRTRTNWWWWWTMCSVLKGCANSISWKHLNNNLTHNTLPGTDSHVEWTVLNGDGMSDPHGSEKWKHSTWFGGGQHQSPWRSSTLHLLNFQLFKRIHLLIFEDRRCEMNENTSTITDRFPGIAQSVCLCKCITAFSAHQ
jgi:hypothetical protein